MLKMQPKERFPAERALNHPWIKKQAPGAKDVKLHGNFVDNLRSFRSQNKLKKAALHIIANNLTEDEIKKLRDTFTALDKDGNGILTTREMKDGLEKAGLKEVPHDLQEILQDVDADGSGQIDYTEFLAATLDKRVYKKEEVCWQAFGVFDLNGDGKISKEELRLVLENGDVKSVAGADALAEIMQSVDSNGDGHIDFQEFMAMMKGATDHSNPSKTGHSNR
jgi:calcium-dependent protein kinase